MTKKNREKSDASEVQVFELTMDNPENQDELNCELRKPGESDRRQVTHTTTGKSTKDSGGKKES